MKNFFYLLGILFLVSCGNSTNSAEFVEATQGRYLFNSDETIEVYYTENVLNIKWRGKDITPIKASDSSFYVKDMNEKLIFVAKPEIHIELAPKREHDGKIYHFTKLGVEKKTPAEYFKNKEYEKAKDGYLAIQRKDSADRNISQRAINQLGYKFMREKKYEEAKEIFRINIALYPNSSKSYDSMGDAYLKEKDTTKALEYYKKALSINPENRGSKANVERLTKKK